MSITVFVCNRGALFTFLHRYCRQRSALWCITLFSCVYSEEEYFPLSWLFFSVTGLTTQESFPIKTICQWATFWLEIPTEQARRPSTESALCVVMETVGDPVNEAPVWASGCRWRLWFPGSQILCLRSTWVKPGSSIMHHLKNTAICCCFCLFVHV